MTVFKKSIETSKMNAEEFSVTAEREFSAMMPTLRNSDITKQSKFQIFGTGTKSRTSFQTSSASQTDETRNQQESYETGSQESARYAVLQTLLNNEVAQSIACLRVILDFKAFLKSFKEQCSISFETDLICLICIFHDMPYVLCVFSEFCGWLI